MNILVDRRAALGDALMITPVLKELRKRYPTANINVVTDFPEVLRTNPSVNKVMRPAELPTDSVQDLYINLNGAYENNVTSHYIDSYLYRAFGSTEGMDKSITLVSTPEEVETIEDVKSQLDSEYMVVHMRRFAWENKNVDLAIWEDYFTKLHAAHPTLKIVGVGAKYDYRAVGHVQRVDLVNQLSVGELAHLIAGAKCFIGGDSAPYHIAATTSTPIVALLSHLAPEQIVHWRDGEFGKGTTVVQSDVGCLGCYARQKPPVNVLTCENPVQWQCNKKFSVEQMVAATEKYL